MPDSGFDRLQKQLLESGVAPRHVDRIVSELSDHYEDLETEAMQLGLSREVARAQAHDRMGDTNIIAQQVLALPELKCWFYRFPKLARVVLPIAYVLMLPTAPVFAGVAYAPLIGRWCMCLMLGGIVTAGMLLGMQMAILYS